ncbi:MAG TPA: c-type cytochrome [Planctomycetes bacterium]|nr:c-type cytochrome [Planctomycetota bacterium]
MHRICGNQLCWWLVCNSLLLVGGQAVAQQTAGTIAGHRSPVDLAINITDAWAVTANQSSHSVSLVSLREGVVWDEVRVGDRPVGVTLGPLGRRVYVGCSYSGNLHVLEVSKKKLVPVAVIHTGWQPHDVAISPDNKWAYVALYAANQVGVIDLQQGKLVETVDVGRWPRYLGLSPDGKRLAVGASGDGGVSVVDTVTKKMISLQRFVAINVGHMQVSKDGQYAYFPWMFYHHNPVTKTNIQRGWVLASRLGRVRLDKPGRRESFSLDVRGQAVGDPHGLALSPQEDRIVLAASGSHELLVYRQPGLPFQEYGDTDHLIPALQRDQNRFYRIPVGGRPMGMQFGSQNHIVYVANYLHNAIQIVDLDKRQLVGQIELGKTPALTAARRGEVIFHDAQRSLDQWYSCHSCHYEGGINSERMDTFNDGTAFTFKTVLPLYAIEQTAPWTWHGWQKDLTAAMRKSITSTMLGKEPSEQDVTDLLSYLKTLQPPPNPYRQRDGSLSPAAKRGQTVFRSSQAGCASCHKGPHFTDGKIHDLGLGEEKDKYQGFNTPTLSGVYRKVRLMHHGRAKTLQQVLSEYHAPEDVGGSGQLSEQQLADLIAYLKSL